MSIPRTNCPNPMSENSCRESHVFSGASTEAVSVCSYLWLINGNSEVIASFVTGKASLAPLQTTGVLRLELCAAILAVKLVDIITEEVDIQLNSVTFDMNSRVVLG